MSGVRGGHDFGGAEGVLFLLFIYWKRQEETEVLAEEGERCVACVRARLRDWACAGTRLSSQAV